MSSLLKRQSYHERTTPEQRDSHRQANRIRKVQAMARYLNGEYYESRAGVPLVVVQIGSRRASVCWFARSKSWRIFFPFLEFHQEQEKTNHETHQSIMERIIELRMQQAKRELA